jgi:hypothetical protein
MRNLCWLKLAMGLITAGTLSAGTIDYSVTALGGGSYRYDYSVSGFTFQPNEQLDVRFDPTLYGALSHGVAPTGFSVTLLNPNNPPGDFGDYTALAQINNPSTANPFSVQVVYLGAGQPGSQPFFLNQFNADGFFIATVDGGFTSQVVATETSAPEPSTLTLICAALLFGGLWVVRGRFIARMS